MRNSFQSQSQEVSCGGSQGDEGARVLGDIQNLRVVTVKSGELAQRFREGFFKNMKPCVYNPASNTLKLVVLG
jgi:hypothetical protein